MNQNLFISFLKNEKGGFSKTDLGITSFLMLSVALYAIIPSHDEIYAKTLYICLSVAGFIASIFGGYTAPLAMFAAVGAGILVRAKSIGLPIDLLLPWLTYIFILIASITFEAVSDKKEKKTIQKEIQKVGEAETMGDLRTLKKALKESSVAARDESMAAIIRIGGEAAIETLIDVGYYDHAVNQFGENAIKRLLELVESGHAKEMRYAVLTIGRTGEKKVLDRVLEYKSNDTIYIRENVAESLGTIGGEKAGNELSDMASDGEWYVRKTVAKAMGIHGGKEILNALADLAEDPYWQVREVVAESFGRIGGPQALKTLLNLSVDENIEVRKKTKSALEEIGTTEAVEAAGMIILENES